MRTQNRPTRRRSSTSRSRRRPATRRPTARRPANRRPSAAKSRRTLGQKVVAATGALALVAVAVFVGVQQLLPPGVTGAIDVVDNIDDKTAAFDPSKLKEAVQQDAYAFADAGGGVLRTWVSAGDPAQKAGDADLQILRDDRPEGDPGLRHQAVDERVEAAFADMVKTVPTGEGRSLWSMLSPLSRPAGDGPWIVYLVTVGLPTAAPEDARVLMAADPSAAVASLPDSAIADLTGAQVHVVFAAPAGDQDVLTSKSSAWRSAYVEQYIQRAGGTVVEVVETGGSGTAAPGAPSAPPVDNLPDTTWVVPPVEPDGPIVATIDGASLFYPDSDRLIDEAGARAALQPLADAYATGAYGDAKCTARAAQFGPADVALALTERRAAVGVALLQSMGVPATGIGLGYGSPLPGYSAQAPEQRQFQCVLDKK